MVRGCIVVCGGQAPGGARDVLLDSDMAESGHVFVEDMDGLQVEQGTGVAIRGSSDPAIQVEVH